MPKLLTAVVFQIRPQTLRLGTINLSVIILPHLCLVVDKFVLSACSSPYNVSAAGDSTVYMQALPK